MPMGQVTTCFNNGSQNKYIAQRMKHFLRPHQVKALEALTVHFQQRKPNGALVVMPTGAGKTAVAVLSPYLLCSTKVLVITPSLVITEQMSEAFYKTTTCELVKLGICADVVHWGKAKQNQWKQTWLPTRDPRAPMASEIEDALAAELMIMNAQRVQYHTNAKPDILRAGNYDLVIVDEAHHCPAQTWRNILDQFDRSKTSFLFSDCYSFHNGERVLTERDGITEVYNLSREEAIQARIIRPLRFDDGTAPMTLLAENDRRVEDEDPIKDAFRKITRLVKAHLKHQDEEHAARNRYLSFRSGT